MPCRDGRRNERERIARIHSAARGNSMNKDIVIVGAGPAGIFTALEMIRKGSRKRVAIVEKGQPRCV